MSNNNAVSVFQTPAATAGWLAKLKPQMQLALPKHLNVERMTRLVLTAFSSNPKLAECSPHSVAASIMTASQLGLEPGINGQGWLVPYAGTCTFVPGWKGLVDLANRGGRCTTWTGAVYRGDDFDFMLGDNPYVRHKPGDEIVESYENLLYVYAVGRIKGQDVPVIEVWRKAKVWNHLQIWNKVGEKHYALAKGMVNFEMYARKIPLLQVLKYMPQSVELTAAMEAARAAEEGRTITIDGATWVTTDNPPEPGREGEDDAAGAAATPSGPRPSGPSSYPQALFDSSLPNWRSLIEAGKKTHAEVIRMAETKAPLTEEQKAVVLSCKAPAAREEAPVVTPASVKAALEKAPNKEALDDAALRISAVADAFARESLTELYERRTHQFQGDQQ